jgi:hypothetical protein
MKIIRGADRVYDWFYKNMPKGCGICCSRTSRAIKWDEEVWKKHGDVTTIYYIEPTLRKSLSKKYPSCELILCDEKEWVPERKVEIKEGTGNRLVILGHLAGFKGHSDLAKHCKEHPSKRDIHVFGSGWPKVDGDWNLSVMCQSNFLWFEQDGAHKLHLNLRNWIFHDFYDEFPIEKNDVVMFPYRPGKCENSYEYCLLEALQVGVEVRVLKEWHERFLSKKRSGITEVLNYDEMLM